MVHWGYIKDGQELERLTTNELILLLSQTIKETKVSRIKGSGLKPNYKQIEYREQHQKQALKIMQLLKNRKITTNYLYLKCKYLQLKYLKFK